MWTLGNNACRFKVPKHKVKKNMCGACVSFKMFTVEVGELELIKIRYNHLNTLWGFLG